MGRRDSKDGKKKKKNVIKKTYPLFQEKVEGPWKPGTAATVTTMVEISISCRDLQNRDLLSKSDPMAAVFFRPPVSKRWVPLLRTEMMDDTLDPEFEKKVVIEYRFEQFQPLRFEIYDIDSEFTDKLTFHDSLGYIETSVGQIVGAGDEGLDLELATPNSGPADKCIGRPPRIILRAEEVPAGKDEVQLQISGYSVGTWFFIFPPKVCYAIYKLTDSGKHVIIHRSQLVRGTSPSWPVMKLTVSGFCSGDYDRQLRIDVFQHKSRQGLVLIGSMITSLNKMMAPRQEKVQLMDFNGQAVKAFIKIVSCTVDKMDTFMEYLKTGTRLHCIYAIDYTCSNGDPCDLQSLHYVNPANPNVYEQAIQAVGNILLNYDQFSLFPAFGFGACLPPKGDFFDDFPLTLDERNVNCNSLTGVLENYRKCLRECLLYGPTNFAPMIRRVSKMASTSRFGLDYYILVMITDGVITDLPLTKKAIVEAAGLPLSIVIIGVGDADFESMEELDGDGIRVTYRGKRAVRDIVQFVPFRSARSWLSSTGEPTELELLLRQEEEDEETPKPIPPPLLDDDDDDPMDLALDLGDIVIPIPVATSATAVQEEPETEEQHFTKTNPAQLAMSILAQEVLAEIPSQIMSYMQLKRITPETIKEGLIKERKDIIKAKKEKAKLERKGGEVIEDEQEPNSGESSSSESEDEEETGKHSPDLITKAAFVQVQPAQA